MTLIRNRLYLDFKDYRMNLIGIPANQGKSIMAILQSRKSWLRPQREIKNDSSKLLSKNVSHSLFIEKTEVRR